jgi:hypothetical protein
MSRRMRELTFFVLGSSIAMIAASNRVAQAANVLLNGGLEQGASPDKWTLTQTVNAQGDYDADGSVNASDYVLWRKGATLLNQVATPTATTPEDYTEWRARLGSASVTGSVTEQVDSANQPAIAPGELGLYVKPFAGNEGSFQDQNRTANVTLSQTRDYASTLPAGRTWTMTGWVYLQAASSPVLNTLYSDSPSGAIASPSKAYMEMAFLNASGAVLGTQTVDLHNDTPDTWNQHTLSTVAPAGTTQVRVTAAANKLLASCTSSCPAGQDIYFDNFSLLTPPSSTEQLQNPNLNTPGPPANWTIQKTPEDNLQFSTNPTFCCNTPNNPSSVVGMWLRAFSGGDAKILQTVSGAAGTNYTFSGWSKWEANYSGADPATSTQTFLTLEFLDSSSNLIGSALTADLKGGLDHDIFTPDAGQQQPDETWRQFSIAGTSPAGTAFVRVSAGATGMVFDGPGPKQSALFDDFALVVPGSGTGNLLKGGSVPEPSAFCLVLGALTAVLSLGRRR